MLHTYTPSNAFSKEKTIDRTKITTIYNDCDCINDIIIITITITNIINIITWFCYNVFCII